MYFLVSLKETAQKVVIPQKWIFDLNLESLLNSGIKFKRKKVYKVFISNADGEEPDFGLSVLVRLDLKRPACYQAYIIKAFGINCFFKYF